MDSNFGITKKEKIDKNYGTEKVLTKTSPYYKFIRKRELNYHGHILWSYPHCLPL